MLFEITLRRITVLQDDAQVSERWVIDERKWGEGIIGTPHLNLKKKQPYILYHWESKQLTPMLDVACGHFLAGLGSSVDVWDNHLFNQNKIRSYFAEC